MRFFAKRSLDSLFQPQFPYPDEFILEPRFPSFQGHIYSLPQGPQCQLRDQENPILVAAPAELRGTENRVRGVTPF